MERAALSLWEAESRSAAIAPLRMTFPEVTIDDAYVIQGLNHERRHSSGQRQSGWKVELVTAAIPARSRVSTGERQAGALFADMSVRSGDSADVSRLIQPRVEAEIAFVLGDDLPLDEVTLTDVLRATAFVVPAVEIVDSRITDWDVGPVDAVADNACAALFALGTVPRTVMGLDFTEIELALSIDSIVQPDDHHVNSLGSPVESVVWLANFLAFQGRSLQAGEIVLSGSRGRRTQVKAGQKIEACFAGLGSLAIDLGDC